MLPIKGFLLVLVNSRDGVSGGCVRPGQAVSVAQLLQTAHPAKQKRTSRRVSHLHAGTAAGRRAPPAPSAPAPRPPPGAPRWAPPAARPLRSPAHPAPGPLGRAPRRPAGEPGASEPRRTWRAGRGASGSGGSAGAPRGLAGPLDLGRRRGLNRDGS